jgi:hypothetical protein
MIRRNTVLGCVLALGAAGGVLGQTGEFSLPITNTQALEAYQVQGEYFGTISGGGGNLGAWVISMGNNSYNVSFLPGGLLEIPGQAGGGWNKTTRYNGTGTAASLTTTNGFAASITGTGMNRVMTGTTNTGAAFTLNKVQRISPTKGLKPQAAWGTAESWFDSTTGQADLTKWTSRDNAPELKFGFLRRGPQSKGAITSGFLHIEVRSSFCPTCRDQNRGNSGIYMRGMHEMQVLDSFGLTGADNELGSIYKVKAPSVNAALPPLVFQTYDCYYTAGSGNTGTFTVYLNGVQVQNATSVPGITEAGFAGTTLYLQNHGTDAVFNNVWFIPNATTTSLPYQTILSGVVGIKGDAYRISPKRDRMADWHGIDGVYNLLGRKVDGKSLTVTPIAF